MKISVKPMGDGVYRVYLGHKATDKVVCGNKIDKLLDDVDAIKLATDIMKRRYGNQLGVLLEDTTITMEAMTMVALVPIKTVKLVSNNVQKMIHQKLKDLGWKRGRGWGGYKKIEANIVED